MAGTNRFTLRQGRIAEFLSDQHGFLSFLGGKDASGLSIGTSSIKVVELKKSGKSWSLVKFGLAPLADDTIINREIGNPVAVTDGLKNLLNETKISAKQVCTGIGGPSIMIKRMMVEVQNVKEIQDAVFWEAEQYLPFDPSEVSMDYHLISRGKDNKTDVIFVAAKLSVMDGYIQAIEGAGLKTKIVDTEFFALQNIFEANYAPSPQEAVALVDIGASSTKILVVHAGVPVYTKDSTLGGRMLTAEIQKNLNLSYADAEALKIGHSTGGATPQEVVDLMQASVENYAIEIKRTLDFYNASSSGAPITYCLLTGGGAKLPDLTQIVEERVGVPTQILNPFSKIQYDAKSYTPEMIQSVAPLIALPMGLAMRGAIE